MLAVTARTTEDRAPVAVSILRHAPAWLRLPPGRTRERPFFLRFSALRARSGQIPPSRFYSPSLVSAIK